MFFLKRKRKKKKKDETGNPWGGVHAERAFHKVPANCLTGLGGRFESCISIYIHIYIYIYIYVRLDCLSGLRFDHFLMLQLLAFSAITTVTRGSGNRASSHF